MQDATDPLKEAHQHSSGHRDELKRSPTCGCFYCCEVYAPDAIKEWIDEEDTALCPICGIDSVIGSASGFPVGDAEFLLSMRKRWFW
jgi:hypothetical protein